MKYYDLHTHSTYSDGVCSPKELLDLAKKEGLAGISITDHDSIFGLPEGIKYASQIGLELITGVEIQAYGPEILGYFIDIKSPELNALLEDNQKKKQEHLKRKIDGLIDLNIDIDFQEVSDYAKERSYHQTMIPHIAMIMVEKGYGRSIQDVFDKYLNKVKVRLETEPTRAKKVIETIRIAGGVSVLPHPWLLRTEQKDNIENYIIKLTKYGLAGIETRGSIPDNLKEESHDLIERIRVVCKKQDLVETSGSDFHGPSTHKDCFLGKPKSSEEIVKELERRRE